MIPGSNPLAAGETKPNGFRRLCPRDLCERQVVKQNPDMNMVSKIQLSGKQRGMGLKPVIDLTSQLRGRTVVQQNVIGAGAFLFRVHLRLFP